MAQLDEIKFGLILEVLERASVEAVCVRCGVKELLFEVDGPFDSIFLANYHCEECDKKY